MPFHSATIESPCARPPRPQFFNVLYKDGFLFYVYTLCLQLGLSLVVRTHFTPYRYPF